MREVFHEQLDSIFDDLAGICRSVETAVRLANQALLTGDAEIAEQVTKLAPRAERVHVLFNNNYQDQGQRGAVALSALINKQ